MQFFTKNRLHHFCTLLLLSWTLSLNGQAFMDFVSDVQTQGDPAIQQMLVDQYMDTVSSVPVIEGTQTVIFLFQGNASTVDLAGDFNFWNPNWSLSKVGATDLWYYQTSFETNARMDYKIVRNGNEWILDPLNPFTIPGGFGANSELRMPDYEFPEEILYREDIEHGELLLSSIASAELNATHQLQIYLPPSYEVVTNRSYPVVYFHDGTDYVNFASAVNVLDNSIADGLLSEVIAVFVRPNDRNEEYAFSKRNAYRLFFVNELVPYIDATYRTVPEATHRALIGDSFGGNISAYIAYEYPDVFGNCGLQSGAFWPNDYEVSDLLVNGPAKEIRIASFWGTYEGNLTTNMDFVANELLLKGYDITAGSYAEGHSWGLWRATLDDILIYFFPPGLTQVEMLSSETSNSSTMYPNPSSGWSILHLSDINPVTNYTLALIGMDGTMHWQTMVRSGRQEIRWPSKVPSGWYVVQIKQGTLIIDQHPLHIHR